MAKVEFHDGDFGVKLEQLGGRETIRRIVEAGVKAAVKLDRERTVAAGHVITGQLKEGFGPGIYHEDLDAAWQYVYPQGTDSDGQDLAKIAFVINYGYGGKRTAKTGDKFMTGKKPQLDDAVREAMAAEAERIKNDIMR